MQEQSLFAPDVPVTDQPLDPRASNDRPTPRLVVLAVDDTLVCVDDLCLPPARAAADALTPRDEPVDGAGLPDDRAR